MNWELGLQFINKDSYCNITSGSKKNKETRIIIKLVPSGANFIVIFQTIAKDFEQTPQRARAKHQNNDLFGCLPCALGSLSIKGLYWNIYINS